MSAFDTAAALLTITALFSYVNFRYVRLPTTIGVMLIALVTSALIVCAGHFPFAGGLRDAARAFLERVDFDRTLMEGMLSFLLFAGALQVNLDELSEHKVVVGTLATAGVVLSTWVIGTAAWLFLGGIGFATSYASCLLFGALISPTDPIAVLGLLRGAGVPRRVEVRIAGESLFNDGVGVVVFLVVSEIAIAHEAVGAGEIARLFAVEAGGGALFGLAAGGLAFRMLRAVDNYQVEVLITLALVAGGYALASALHLSGPIAVVVAGLLIGNHGRRLAMSARTRANLDMFWELIDEVLNGVLFVLIGFEMLALTFSAPLLAAGLAAVPTVLAARWASVGLPLLVLRRWRAFDPREHALLTWGGLRGGISVALALSLPAGPAREVILAMTYTVVVCSIVGQGLTMPRVARRLFPATRAATAPRGRESAR